ncbi:unnamed protein product [Linum grandiflorum]
MILFHCGESRLAGTKTFRVGDGAGWAMEVVKTWPKGKCFNSGDILEFTYNFEWHNVIVANKTEYESCTLPIRGGSAFQTGDDFIPLHRGHNYFFDAGTIGLCQQGFKMTIVTDQCN